MAAEVWRSERGRWWKTAREGNQWVIVTDRQQKDQTQENSCFFKKISLIHDYRSQNILLLIAWLPYGINSSAEVFIYHVRALPDFKKQTNQKNILNFCSGFSNIYRFLVWDISHLYHQFLPTTSVGDAFHQELSGLIYKPGQHHYPHFTDEKWRYCRSACIINMNSQP